MLYIHFSGSTEIHPECLQMPSTIQKASGMVERKWGIRLGNIKTIIPAPHLPLCKGFRRHT
jgi:hypothetical protein